MGPLFLIAIRYELTKYILRGKNKRIVANYERSGPQPSPKEYPTVEVCPTGLKEISERPAKSKTATGRCTEPLGQKLDLKDRKTE